MHTTGPDGVLKTEPCRQAALKSCPFRNPVFFFFFFRVLSSEQPVLRRSCRIKYEEPSLFLGNICFIFICYSQVPKRTSFFALVSSLWWLFSQFCRPSHLSRPHSGFPDHDPPEPSSFLLLPVCCCRTPSRFSSRRLECSRCSPGMRVLSLDSALRAHPSLSTQCTPCFCSSSTMWHTEHLVLSW